MWTDHKPLESISWTGPDLQQESKDGSLSTASFSSLKTPGQRNIADALSRSRNIEETRARNFVTNTAVPNAMTGGETEKMSGEDDQLENLRQCIKTGSSENASCSDYKSLRDELCIFGNMVLRGTRIAVQRKFRARVTGSGHEVHQGMLRMKQRSGGQNLIRKSRTFARHVMGDKL